MNFTRKRSIVLFVVFLLASALVWPGCGVSDGEKCSSCDKNSDCDDGLSCFSFDDGKNRCAKKRGDSCSTYRFAGPFDTMQEAEKKVSR